MSMQSRLMQRARELQQAGRYADARAVLDTVLAVESNNDTAWQMRLAVSETRADQERALQALVRLHPDDTALWNQLIDLKTSAAPPPARSQHYRKLYWGAALLTLVVAAVALFFVSHNPLQSDVDRLTADNLALTQDFQELDRRFNQLSTDYRKSRADYAQLLADYGGLQATYQRLQTDYAGLQADYQKLQSADRALQQAHTALQTDYANLQAIYANLQTTYGRLQADYRIAVPPPYILIRGREITLTFTLSTGRLDTWTAAFSVLENDLQRGLRWRDPNNHLIPTTTVRNAADAPVEVMDFRSFVDPGEFNTVMQNLYEETGHDEQALLVETWRVLKQLTRYVSDGYAETPRFPSETLISGGGDCEDTAILYASMLKAAPVHWKVSLFYMDADNITAPQVVNHVAVLVEGQSGVHIIETTSLNVMEPYPANAAGWIFEIQ